MTHKEYIGDSVYAEFDGLGIWLTTENGIETSNKIYLEPAVLMALADYVDRLREDLERTTGSSPER